MNKLMLVLLFFTINDAKALIYLELSAGIGAGNIEITDTSGPEYLHEGLVLEADSNVRLGLDFLGLSLGGLFNQGQFNASYTRKALSSASIAEEISYETSYEHQYVGAFLGYKLPNNPFRLWGEYYVSTELTVHYAERRAENIFTKEDKYTGKGYGAGLGYQLTDTVYVFLFYRAIEFDQLRVKASGLITSLPSDSFGKLKLSQGLIGVTFVASWL